jgi:twinkle protein
MSLEASILAQDLGSSSEFYTTANHWQIKLTNGFHNGKQPGETSYISALDEIFTLRMGFLYCFTGWPGSGKSEFITQISVLQAYFKKRKTAFYSPESYPADEFIDTFIHCYLGKSTDRRFPNVCSEDEYKKAIEWMNEYFYYCDWEDTPDSEKIINSFTFLHKEKGVEIFVIDPFNALISEGEDRNIAVALKRNLTALKRFAYQNRVMVWLVEHPRTAADSSEYDKVPNNRNLFGGTMWWNKVDVGVSIHRANREDKHNDEVIIQTWKVKRQELNGRPGERTLHFSVRHKRYFQDVHYNDHPMSTIQVQSDLMYKEDDQPF